MRIVSLVPSITETLFDFEVGEALVGRTKFCIHPKSKVQQVPIVGGTKNLNIEKIKSLQPDLIIANKEENVKDQIENLSQDFDVWVTDISTLEDVNSFFIELGLRLNKTAIAKIWSEKLNLTFNKIQKSSSIKVAYLIWQNPYMVTGGNTFIHEMLSTLGFNNIFKHHNRYPEVNISDLENADCIFLSSEPYPFKEKHLKEFQSLLPNHKIKIVDGEAFSWYGTRIIKSQSYYQELLNSL